MFTRILSPVPRIIPATAIPAAVSTDRTPVAAGNDGGDARRIRLTAAGSFLHFQNAKTGRPAGRSDPDLRAACTSRLLIHIPF